MQLRTKINAIKEDDRRILWEGVDSLNEEELQEACKLISLRCELLILTNLLLRQAKREE